MSRDSPAAGFPTTRWSVVGRAGGDAGEPSAREALEGLCRDYWYPLYAFARRRGCLEHEAEDVVQGLFAALLERGDFAGLDPARGRFRAFLRAACEHHLSNRRDHDRAAQRGGGRAVISIDRIDAEGRYGREPADRGMSPDRLFDRQWALTLLGCVLGRLEAESAASGKSALFDRLRPALQGDGLAPSSREIAEALGMSEGAVRVAAHRLRARYRELLRAEVARTTDDPADVDREIADLLAALGGG